MKYKKYNKLKWEAQPLFIPRGYDYVEQHTVQTQDRYLLCLHRLPYGKREGDPKMNTGKRRSRSRSTSVVASTAVVDNIRNFVSSKEPTKNLRFNSTTSNFSQYRSRDSFAKRRHWNGKPVVLLNHGFLMSSEIWLCNLKESQNLPFLLTEQGCDVWFANARGNKYSQQHMSKSPQDQRFWEFSLNEMAMYDLPDIVDVCMSFWIMIWFNRLGEECWSSSFDSVYFGNDRCTQLDVYRV